MGTSSALFAVLAILGCLIAQEEAAARPYGFHKSDPLKPLPPPFAWPPLPNDPIFDPPSPPTPAAGTYHGRFNWSSWLPVFNKPPPSPPLPYDHRHHHKNQPHQSASSSVPDHPLFPDNFPPASQPWPPLPRNKWPSIPFPFPHRKAQPAPNSHEHYPSQPPFFAPNHIPHDADQSTHQFPAPAYLLSPQSSEVLPRPPSDFETSPPLSFDQDSLSPVHSPLSPLASSEEALPPTD